MAPVVPVRRAPIKQQALPTEMGQPITHDAGVVPTALDEQPVAPLLVEHLWETPAGQGDAANIWANDTGKADTIPLALQSNHLERSLDRESAAVALSRGLHTDGGQISSEEHMTRTASAPNLLAPLENLLASPSDVVAGKAEQASDLELAKAATTSVDAVVLPTLKVDPPLAPLLKPLAIAEETPAVLSVKLPPIVKRTDIEKQEATVVPRGLPPIVRPGQTSSTSVSEKELSSQRSGGIPPVVAAPIRR